MPVLAILIEYDGSRYGGWQFQPNAETIQGCLERGIERITGLQLSVTGAGRTDAGVHSRGQVAHIKLKSDFVFPIAKFKQALNANLPRDIRVLDTKLLDFDFHSRFDAIAREYSYSFSISLICLSSIL